MDKVKVTLGTLSMTGHLEVLCKVVRKLRMCEEVPGQDFILSVFEFLVTLI